MKSKHFVVRIKYLIDGTIDKGEIMEFDTRKQAIAYYHISIGEDMEDETLCGSLCTIIDSYGMEIMHDSWSKPIVPEVSIEQE